MSASLNKNKQISGSESNSNNNILVRLTTKGTDGNQAGLHKQIQYEGQTS